MKTTVLAAAVLTLSALFTSTAKADHFEHIDSLAAQLRNQASRTAWEVRHNFRGAPEYRHLYRDVYELYTTADHVHEIIHAGTSIEHIRADVESLDRLLHHAQDVVRGIRPADDFHFHGHGFHGHGHAPVGPTRNDLRRLRSMLDQMEDTLHHLQDDVRVASGGAPPAAPIAVPVPYEFRVGSGRVGVSVRIP